MGKRCKGEIINMGWRYRKQIKILPGVKLNISKSGISTSVGRRGASLNFSKRGTRATVGLPGTGLSYSTTISGKRRRSSSRVVSRQEINRDRKSIMKNYGISRSQMRRFERKFRRNPQKYRGMSEEQLLHEITGKHNSGRIRTRNGSNSHTKTRSFFKVLGIIFLVLVFLSLLSSGRTH